MAKSIENTLISSWMEFKCTTLEAMLTGILNVYSLTWQLHCKECVCPVDLLIQIHNGCSCSLQYIYQ
jgi:hypothetical protein